MTSCAECLAWGLTYCQGVCLACYNFAARYRSHAGECAACRAGCRFKRQVLPPVLVPGPPRPRRRRSRCPLGGRAGPLAGTGPPPPAVLRRDGQQARRAPGAAPPPRREGAPAQASATRRHPARHLRHPAGAVRVRARPGLPPGAVRPAPRRGAGQSSGWPGPCTWPTPPARPAAGSPCTRAACSASWSPCWPATATVRPSPRPPCTRSPAGTASAATLPSRSWPRWGSWPRTARPVHRLAGCQAHRPG